MWGPKIFLRKCFALNNPTFRSSYDTNKIVTILTDSYSFILRSHSIFKARCCCGITDIEVCGSLLNDRHYSFLSRPGSMDYKGRISNLNCNNNMLHGATPPRQNTYNNIHSWRISFFSRRYRRPIKSVLYLPPGLSLYMA